MCKLVKALDGVCRSSIWGVIQVALGHPAVEVGTKVRRSIDKIWETMPTCCQDSQKLVCEVVTVVFEDIVPVLCVSPPQQRDEDPGDFEVSQFANWSATISFTGPDRN